MPNIDLDMHQRQPKAPLKRGSLDSRYTSQLVTHIRRVGELYKPLQYRVIHFTKRRTDYIDTRVVVNLLLANHTAYTHQLLELFIGITSKN